MQDEFEYSEHFFRKTAFQGHKIKKVLHSEKSQWQKIEVLDTFSVGKLLLLDGKTMVSDKDEFVYHEVMSHIPYAVSPDAKNVLIIGGGDGGIVREFVKYAGIERIDLVEIDERVIEVSREFFPGCTSGLDDARVTIHCRDGIEFLKQKQNEYDIIIIDSTDPEDFAEGLFCAPFYASVANALRPNGIMMAQTENPFYDEFNIGNIYNNLRAAFPIVKSLTAPMIIYPGVFWTFAFASKSVDPTHIRPDKKEIMEKISQETKWYNTKWHEGAFAISNFHKQVTGIK
jgi:spermidine synthase